MFQVQTSEEEFLRGFREGYSEAAESFDDFSSFESYNSAPNGATIFAAVVIAYVLLWAVFWILPWQRVIWRAGYRGISRRILRVLISSPPVNFILFGLTEADFFGIAFFLMPVIGTMWLAFAPWPTKLQKAEPEKPQDLKRLPPVTKFGQIDMLSPGVWVVQCADGAYWIREAELERLELPLATRLGKQVTFIPIANVKIPSELVGKIIGVVRNGLSHVAAVA